MPAYWRIDPFRQKYMPALLPQYCGIKLCLKGAPVVENWLTRHISFYISKRVYWLIMRQHALVTLICRCYYPRGLVADWSDEKTVCWKKIHKIKSRIIKYFYMNLHTWAVFPETRSSPVVDNNHVLK